MNLDPPPDRPPIFALTEKGQHERRQSLQFQQHQRMGSVQLPSSFQLSTTSSRARSELRRLLPRALPLVLLATVLWLFLAVPSGGHRSTRSNGGAVEAKGRSQGQQDRANVGHKYKGPRWNCPDDKRGQAYRRGISDPYFWTTHGSKGNTRISIVTARPLPEEYLPCLEGASFSTRLMGARGLLKALPPPVWVPETHSYDFSLPSVVPVPAGSYTIEVLLEFGTLPGANTGMPCGPRREGCESVDVVREVLAEVSKVIGFVGKKVGQSLPVEITARVGLESRKEKEVITTCDTTAKLSGYWQGMAFKPTVDRAQCALVPLSTVPVLRRRTGKDPIWIHFIGDNNMGHVYSLVAGVFGDGVDVLYIGGANDVHSGKGLAGLAVRSSSGHYQSQSNDSPPDIILTWTFWHEGFTPQLRTDVDELVLAATETLPRFIARAKMRTQLSKRDFSRLHEPRYRNLRPTRAYITVGSEMEGTTALSMASLMRLVAQTDLLAPAPNPARFMTSAMVDAGAGWVQYHHPDMSDFTRNNIVLKARNRELRAALKKAGAPPALDIEGLTEGLTSLPKLYMAKMVLSGKTSHWQFLPGVYREWARLLLTDYAEASVESTLQRANEVDDGDQLADGSDDEDDEEEEVVVVVPKQHPRQVAEEQPRQKKQPAPVKAKPPT